MNRCNMIWIFLAVGLSSVYETKGSDNVFTMRWDSQVKTDLSFANLVCFFQSEPLKVVYHMTNGVEYPESQHEQFAGRVYLDRGPLKEGGVRLYLSRVTAEDSGDYSCEVTANFDKNSRKWGLEATEYYVLNVAQNKDGGNIDKPLINLKSGLTAFEDVRSPSGGLKQEIPVYLGSAVAPLILVALICALLMWATCLSQAACVCRDKQHEQIKPDLDAPLSSRLRQIMRRSYLPCELTQQKTLHQQPKLLQV